MRATIIIPCYNYEKYIGDCIKSCVAQGDCETIVVDDCSTDGSADIIKKYPVKYIKTEKNSGYSYAKNIGIKESAGEWIVHIDADDMLVPGSVKTRLDVLNNFPNSEVIHGYALKIQGDVSYEWCIKNIGKLERHPSKLHAQGFMIHRKVFERCGLYYEPLRSKSDKEYWYRIGIHDKTPLPSQVDKRRCHCDVAFYRRHENAMHKMRNKNPVYDNEIEKIFDSRIKQLLKEGITKENTKFL